MKNHSILLVLLFSIFAFITSCNKSASGNAGEAVQEDNKESVSSEPADECEQFIADYRNWADRYAVIAQKLKSNPNDMNVMNEFTNMANELATWQTRIQDCSDSKSIEQLNEISQRLMQAAQSGVQ